ncbi:hypothetical protein GCM10011579_087980 [Streptomyces albiflavescens]|uniref:Uncharacterized protein n=1 Tax=Streptomyces albiflavescens TaxID=1623582 RepID=A0A917YEJ8_9ACTN|nr:hypothetical protein [Streptomyces albiflavescens]GGN91279.1 hypothetical protein GCM10011579_087980 [Streptomyces albiflavescens]
MPHGRRVLEVSGEGIEDYAATAGAFRAMMSNLTPEMFPGDPERAAEAIYQAVNAPELAHWVVLGSDAQRRIGVKLDQLRAEFETGKELAFSTDFPGAADNAEPSLDSRERRDGGSWSGHLPPSAVILCGAIGRGRSGRGQTVMVLYSV